MLLQIHFVVMVMKMGLNNAMMVTQSTMMHVIIVVKQHHVVMESLMVMKIVMMEIQTKVMNVQMIVRSPIVEIQ